MNIRILLAIALSIVSALAQRVPVGISTNTALSTGNLLVWSGSAWVVVPPGTEGQVLTWTNGSPSFRPPPPGGGGGGDAYLGNHQTFTGSNDFTGSLRALGTFYVATQSVDRLNVTTLDLGTNIVAVLNGGTGATNASGARAALGTDNADNLTSGTVADVRIASTIARDIEVDAKVSDTAYNASTWDGDTTTAPSRNAVRDKIEALAAGGGGDAYLANDQTFTGKQIFTNAIIFNPSSRRVLLAHCDWVSGNGLSANNIGNPTFSGAAILGGASAVVADATNHFGLVQLSTTTTANSGQYYLANINHFFAQPRLTYLEISRVKSTAAGSQASHGFTDSTTSANPTDGIRIWRSNEFLYPQIWNNGTLTQGYAYTVSSNDFVRYIVRVASDTASVDFQAVNSDTGAMILSTNIAATLPADSSRVFGAGTVAISTNNLAVGVEVMDLHDIFIDGEVAR